MDSAFDVYISEQFTRLGITRLADALDDPAVLTCEDPAELKLYAEVAGWTWVGRRVVLEDGRDGAQVLVGLCRAGLLRALESDPKDPPWIRHLEWMWSVCANESLARRFLDLIPTVVSDATFASFDPAGA
jgi:hypothetical protein